MDTVKETESLAESEANSEEIDGSIEHDESDYLVESDDLEENNEKMIDDKLLELGDIHKKEYSIDNDFNLNEDFSFSEKGSWRFSSFILNDHSDTEQTCVVKLDSNEVGPGDKRILEYFKIFKKDFVPFNNELDTNDNSDDLIFSQLKDCLNTDNQTSTEKNMTPLMNFQINSKKLLRIAQEQQIIDLMSSEERRIEVAKSSITTRMLISTADGGQSDSSSSSPDSDSTSVGYRQTVEMFRPQRMHSHEQEKTWVQPKFLLSLDLNSDDDDYNADSSSVAASTVTCNDSIPSTASHPLVENSTVNSQSNSNNNSSNESSSNGHPHHQRYPYSMLNRPTMLMNPAIRKRRKRLRRSNEYFYVTRNAHVYNLIRYSFSSKYAQQYLKTIQGQKEISDCINNCKNVTAQIIPEEETIVSSKILLVSHQTIKQAKRSNRKYKNYRWHRLLNQGVKFQPYLFSGNLRFLKNDLDSLDYIFERQKGVEELPSYNDHNYVRECRTNESVSYVVSQLKESAKAPKPSYFIGIRKRPKRTKIIKKVVSNKVEIQQPDLSNDNLEFEVIQDFQDIQTTVQLRSKPIKSFEIKNIDRVVNRNSTFSKVREQLRVKRSSIQSNSVVVTTYYMWLTKFHSLLAKHNQTMQDFNLNDAFFVFSTIFRIGLKQRPTDFERELFQFLLAFLRTHFSSQSLRTSVEEYKQRFAGFCDAKLKDPNLIEQFQYFEQLQIIK